MFAKVSCVPFIVEVNLESSEWSDVVAGVVGRHRLVLRVSRGLDGEGAVVTWSAFSGLLCRSGGAVVTSALRRRQCSAYRCVRGAGRRRRVVSAFALADAPGLPGDLARAGGGVVVFVPAWGGGGGHSLRAAAVWRMLRSYW